ncbi:MAG TPA: hypothetical protein VE078_10875 [Thermoanaerobaculia bacterium]|nr:hypothetical protein [Thermoanaerobaculia bacterium]
MIRRLPGPLFILLLAALPAAHAQTTHAQSAGSIDLFQELDSIRLSTAVGGPLDPQGGKEPRLFAGDLRRFNRFQQGLTDALNMKLATCGLFVDQAAPDELSVEGFGRLEELQQCTPRYVYMIQAKVLNSKLKAGQASQAKAEPISLRPVIGLADEAGLERALIEAAVATVAAELRSCQKPAKKNGGAV